VASDRKGGTPAAAALRKHGLRPRKRLGQNFLRDERFLDRIVGAAAIVQEDRVLEIGAGTGVLTRRLAQEARSVVAIELDDSLVALLQADFAEAPNVRIWHGSALDFEPCEHFSGDYKLVGNIPYYITGPIIRHYLEATCVPRVLVLMVQREVAERMVAAPGNLSLLSVSVQFYSEPKIVTRVPRGAFHPPPKVESAIVRLTPRPWPVPPELRDVFFTVARAGFGTRRKTLSNALSIGLGITRDDARSLLLRAGVEERRRAESLDLEEWGAVARAFEGQEGS
jgi:16S rRNA (adenine1518-N6/adenine1519-N6)-dimethyltransferase